MKYRRELGIELDLVGRLVTSLYHVGKWATTDCVLHPAVKVGCRTF
jgi:hypothetical protein